MNENYAAIIVALLALAGVVIREIYNAKYAKSHSMVDDASAAAQFQKMVIDLQKQIDEMKAKEEVREKAEKSHLLINLEVKPGLKPEIVSHGVGIKQ